MIWKKIDIKLYNNYNIIMTDLAFEWNDNKNEINKKKHKISFEEAQTVFYDSDALIIDDPEHSEQEDRFIILGLSKKAKYLQEKQLLQKQNIITDNQEVFP